MANGHDESGKFVAGHEPYRNGGRRKRTDEERFMRVLYSVVDETRLETILEKLAVRAERGEAWAVTLLLAYYAGKPVERKELTGANGGPVVITEVEFVDADEP